MLEWALRLSPNQIRAVIRSYVYSLRSHIVSRGVVAFVGFQILQSFDCLFYAQRIEIIQHLVLKWECGQAGMTVMFRVVNIVKYHCNETGIVAVTVDFFQPIGSILRSICFLGRFSEK